MKSLSVMRTMTSCLPPEAVAVFAGVEVCVEAHKYHREGNLYLNDLASPAAVAIGIANATERRVVFFCEDEILMRDLSSAAQVAASKCINLIFVVLVSKQHRVNNSNTIFDGMSSPKGSLFSMGYLVHNYTPHFNFKGKAKKEIEAIWGYVKGPLACFIDVTPRKYQEEDFEEPVAINTEALTEFLKVD